MGSGDSSINFELRAWTEYANWVRVHSGLTAPVYDAVYVAGMSFPFPHRVVQLLRDPETESITAPAATVETAEAVDVRIERDSAQPKKEFG